MSAPDDIARLGLHFSAAPASSGAGCEPHLSRSAAQDSALLALSRLPSYVTWNIGVCVMCGEGFNSGVVGLPREFRIMRKLGLFEALPGLGLKKM